MVIICYHSTKLSNIKSIQDNGYRESSENNWFGKGIYFFESIKAISDGEKEAINWAVKVKWYFEWAIFEALIEADDYIDLISNDKHMNLYSEIRAELINQHLKSGKEIKDFQERIIYIKLEEAGVDFIRALVEGRKDEGYYSYTVRRPQIQVCVKNRRCIKDNILYKTKTRTR